MSNASPAAMRAVVCPKQGPANEALVLHSDWPLPVRKPNQVLLQVAATSVNPGDWMLRKAAIPIPVKLPKILGEDVAGVVADAPEGSKYKKGDKVFGCTGQNLKSGEQGGSYAEYVAADEDTLCLMPPGVSFLHAAAVPVAGLTAWQALAVGMPLQGKRVLVHAGAGGVGGFAIQVAKAHGAHVITTCSSRNVDYVTKELGADEAIDYTQGPWEQAVTEPFDLVLDAIGGSYEGASSKLLKRGGILCSLGGTGPGKRSVSTLGFVLLFAHLMTRTLLGRLRLAPRFHFVMQDNKASKGLEQMAELMEQGKVKVHIDRVWPLEEMIAAHEYSEQGHTRGKVGILVKDL